MKIYQQTISTWVQFSGIGLHTGLPSFARILPAEPDTGIVFRRTDTGAEVKACVENVVETAYATVLGSGNARISTVEHFLAALYGMGVDNAVVEVDGPELPILDGSAQQIAEAIDFVGTVESVVRRRFVWVAGEEKLQRNGSMVAVAPSDGLEILITVDFPGTLIGKQWMKFSLTPESFMKEISPARTFVLREQIDALWKAGLAKGGSLENAIVVEGKKLHNPEGLRFPDEFVRHKLLDLIGDLALLGRPVRGFFLAVRPGHTVNRSLVEFLSGIADPGAVPSAPERPEPVELLITA
ncbi:MAG: UDP-3-O-[3-hydroxymyristoyl] N-acetylglucosamine deacetylase [Deltaproteobacteria bacterium]|nr:UDP-3-O-[3-hydroxymyristoyl] N-acetylglucosamine deacetylase [Deltaproteobacteria bacterium]